MEKEIDTEIIKNTQESLGRFLKRPQLTEKLLKKPPFRFLHDIVTSVNKSTGFFEGIFDETELISENVKDRESKIAFLNKVIAVLVNTTGKSLNAKPSKIVAGQEADKTNELLQCLAYALEKKLSSREAVTKLKENVTDSKLKNPTKSTKKESKLSSKSSEKLVHKKESIRSVTKTDKTNTKTSTHVKTESVSKKESSKGEKDTPPKQIKSITETSKKQSSSLVPEKEIDVPINESQTRNYTRLESNDDNNKLTESQTVSENTTNQNFVERRNSTIHHVNVSNNGTNEDVINNDFIPLQSTIESEKKYLSNDTAIEKTEAVVKTDDSVQNEIVHSEPATTIVANENEVIKANIANVRPEQTLSETKLPTPKPSLVKSSSEESTASTRPGSVRPSSARPAAPRPRDKHDPAAADALIVGKVNIIQESSKSDEEGDTTIIVVDSKLEDDAEESSLASSNYRGHLVQQILDSQKEFAQSSGKTEIELQIASVKGKEATNQDIEQLRLNIQALSRAANPLGKLLEHIQEDVEIMRQELQQWTKTYEDASNQLTKEKTANEESLFPMHTKIKQLNADIKEKNDKINDLKMEIRKNAARIDKLLASGNRI